MTTKITVSLPEASVAAAKQAVSQGRAPSVSAYVAKALDHTYGAPATRNGSTGDFIDYLSAIFGQPSSEAYGWADDVLGLL